MGSGSKHGERTSVKLVGGAEVWKTMVWMVASQVVVCTRLQILNGSEIWSQKDLRVSCGSVGRVLDS